MQVQKLFEDELARRKIAWSIDAESGRHVIACDEERLYVSLENLARDVATSGDTGKISRFVDTIIEARNTSIEPPAAERLYWNLEPHDYVEPPPYREAVSKRVDRVLVHLSSDGKLVSWVTPELIKSLEISQVQAEAAAFGNLARALSEATLETSDVDDVTLGFIGTPLPIKAALILAPNLKNVLEAELGWPLLAVTPDRDFLYLWAARHSDFASRLGETVVREHSQAPYPVSTEIFELSDQGVSAMGAFSA